MKLMHGLLAAPAFRDVERLESALPQASFVKLSKQFKPEFQPAEQLRQQGIMGQPKS